MKFMITNNGVHPADKWADETVAEISALMVDGNTDDVTPAAAAARQAKRDIAGALFPIFNDHHDRLQKHERGKLAKDPKHAEAVIDPAPHVPSTMEKVNAVLAATPFAAHFAKPEVQAHIANIIAQHSGDVMNIERRSHADKQGN